MKKSRFHRSIQIITILLIALGITAAWFPSAAQAAEQKSLWTSSSANISFPSNSQSGDNTNHLYFTTNVPNAAEVYIAYRIPIPDRIAIHLYTENGWYFKEWQTYFSGKEDVKIWSDPEVSGSNPKDTSSYLFHNEKGNWEPYVNKEGVFPLNGSTNPYLYVLNSTDYYGNFSVTAVLKPIVTVNADEGITYQVTTADPSVNNGLSGNQVAAKYKDSVTIIYDTKENYTIDQVTAAGATNIAIDEENKTITITGIDAPTTVTITSDFNCPHELTYSTSGSTIFETCSKCSHEEQATLTRDHTIPTVYNGTPIEPFSVIYSLHWLGGSLPIVYTDNIDTGTAAGTITCKNQTVKRTFTIQKATPAPLATPTAQNEITYGAKLQDISLNDGWNWADGNIVPKVENQGYTAFYTPQDTQNYDWTSVEGWNETAGCAEQDVAVTVHPKELTVTWGNTTFPYNGAEQFPAYTVSGIVEGDDLSFTTTGAATEAGEYTAAITGIQGEDAANYKLPADPSIPFTIQKATPAPLDTPTAQNEVTYGAKLQDISLNNGWNWADGNIVPKVENQGYTAVFTPSDTKNYDWTSAEGWNATQNRVERNVAVTVLPKELSVTWGNTTFPYNGTEQFPAYTVSGIVEGDDISFTTAGAATEAGEYTAAITGIQGEDAANYKLPADSSITFTIKKATPAPLATPTAQNEITYGAKLQDISLNEGWNWADGNIVPKVENQGYTAFYTPQDTQNYDWTSVEGWNATQDRVERNVAVTVLPKELTVTWGNTTFPYNGEEQFPAYTVSGIVESDDISFTTAGTATEAGTHTAAITGIQGEDAANYKLPADSSITFTIQAPPPTDDPTDDPKDDPKDDPTDDPKDDPAGNICKKDESCPMYRYTDLDLSLWYHDGIHFCIENDLMQGIGNDLFAPNGTTTRAMAVTILWRMEGSPIVSRAMNYTDVEPDQWYTEAIRWADQYGIVEGYGNGLFGTADNITREQMAAILYRYTQYKAEGTTLGGSISLSNFADSTAVSSWAVPAMEWACGNGIIQGIPEDNTTLLKPKNTATRAETATLIQRY